MKLTNFQDELPPLDTKIWVVYGKLVRNKGFDCIMDWNSYKCFFRKNSVGRYYFYTEDDLYHYQPINPDDGQLWNDRINNYFWIKCEIYE